MSGDKITVVLGAGDVEFLTSVIDLYSGGPSRHLVALAAIRLGLESLKADPARLLAVMAESRKAGRLRLRTGGGR